MNPTLSVFIIALNAEKKIGPCLESVSWANEIIVVDSNSTDRTAEIAKKYGAKFSSRAFTDFADQKNYAMSLCSGDWLLSIDSDEVITDGLRVQIQNIIQTPGSCDAYRISRRSVIFGRTFNFSGTQNDAPIRLIRKNKGKFIQPIHEFLDVQGKVGTITNDHLLHYTYTDEMEYWERFHRYTSAEAQFLLQKSFRLSWIDLWIRPIAMFIKLYFVKLGLFDGLQGLQFCLFSAYYVHIKYVKYAQLKRTKTCDHK